MVKLSAELIEQAPVHQPRPDRELDLRGYKIPVIENLGATLDQFDTLDFSDNEVRKLDGFPLLRRLKTLLMNSNRICRIGENLEQALPNLRELILTSNNIQELVSVAGDVVGCGASKGFCSGGGRPSKLFGRLDLDQGGVIVSVRPLRSTTTRYRCLSQLCWKYLFNFRSFESIKVNNHTSLGGDLFDPTI
uniref:Small nuclear ribonucleoprotein polypeptide A' n=1 Tax=Takifugu rubripes TaxID=31033 RepID=A0A674N1I9_TAKRU